MSTNISDKVSYPAKVLLFGEYTVVHGSDSLAIPFYGFSANWDYDLSEKESRKDLLQYIEFLEEEVQNIIDTKSLKTEFEKGLYLASDIPTGYGAGSSGSLVAAIYDRFAMFKERDPEKLRSVFQWMESFFHGSSSGIDPLVSYLKKGIYIKDEKLQIVDIPKSKPLLDKLYLWDSKSSRKTAPLVSWYKEQLQNEAFKTRIESQLRPLNTDVIVKFLEGDSTTFTDLFAKIAVIQIEEFTEMINENTISKITVSARTSEIQVKLCGAGGGGFYLVYIEDPKVKVSPSLIALSS